MNKSVNQQYGVSSVFMICALALSASGVGTASAWGNERDDEFYRLHSMEVTTTEVRDISDEELKSLIPSEESSDGYYATSEKGAGEAIVVINAIINIGKKIWNLIEDNKSVFVLESDAATAYPQGITDWRQLEGWKAPRLFNYQIIYKNAFGMNMIDATFRVLFTYGGSYEGKGKYLSRVTVIPGHVWLFPVGMGLNAQALVPNVVNVGTKESPIAGAEVVLKWTATDPLQKFENSAVFFVRGDGSYKDITHGNR